MLKPTEEQMTVDERRTYLKRRKQAYQEASRGERSRLLTEMEQVTGLHRKSNGSAPLPLYRPRKTHLQHVSMEAAMIIARLMYCTGSMCKRYRQRRPPAMVKLLRPAAETTSIGTPIVSSISFALVLRNGAPQSHDVSHVRMGHFSFVKNSLHQYRLWWKSS